MKKVFEKSEKLTSSHFRRRDAEQFYLNKYYNLFMNKYRFPQLEPRQQDYLLRKFWHLGTISAFIVAGTKPNETSADASVNNYPNGMIAFTTYAPVLYDINDWPILVNLTQSRGASFIPNEPQLVNKDVVIGFAQRNHKSVLSTVEWYIQKIVDVEMDIKTELVAHKTPFIIATTPENEQKMKKLFDRVKNDEDVLYVSADEIDAMKVLTTGNTYNIDRLYTYKQQLENELLTYLGIDNVGGIEKKEHLMVDEVNANNNIINDSSKCFLDCLKEFCEEVSTFLGFPLSVEATSSPVVAESNRNEESEENEDDAE